MGTQSLREHEVVIDLATTADAGELWTVMLAAFVSVAVRFDAARLPPLTEPLDEFAATLTDGTLVLKATAGHRIVGMVRARLVGGTCHIGRLAVVPDLAGRGIGTRLLAEAEARMPRARRFELFTGAASPASLRLYERAGYRRFDERPDAVGIPLAYLEKPGHTA